MIDARGNSKRELKSMYAHKGRCEVCGENTVKMLRGMPGGRLLPEHCFCLCCGQRYYMVIDDLETWENSQWKEKENEL